MKTLKVLTIVAITGLAGTVTANACPSTGSNNAQCQTKKQQKCETKNQNKCQKGEYKKNHQRSEMKEIFKQLDLSAEQQMALKSQRKVLREQMKAKRAERSMSGMRQFISAKGFDKQGFMEMSAKRSQKRAEMRANMFEKKINILTAEQRVKLMTLLQEKQK